MFKLNASSTRGCSVTQKTCFRLTSPVNVTVENQRWGNSFEPPTGGCGHPSVFIKSELWECWTSIVGGARIAFPCIKWHCNQCSKWKKNSSVYKRQNFMQILVFLSHNFDIYRCDARNFDSVHGRSTAANVRYQCF